MNDVVIEADCLSKQYNICGVVNKHRTLRDTLGCSAKAPFKAIRSIFGKQSSPPNGHDQIWALKDVSFEIKRGEVVGLIGRNGAGKSTLLKILSQITEPTRGRAEIHGRVGSLLEVGTGFHPELTGRENLYLNGAILGMKRKEINAKFDKIVAFAEIQKFIDTPVKHYSSGMYLRLAFAVAAHLEPEILVVDEVLAVGDADFQKKCLGKMGEVAKAGRTVLFVSHNMGAISALTSRCLCLSDGNLSCEGDTETVVKAYLRMGAATQQEPGVACLSDLPRQKDAFIHSARYLWARTLDPDEQAKSDFLEGEPIIIELGFAVLEESENFQFGVGVSSMNLGVVLFVVPSKVYEKRLSVGTHVVRLRLNPNPLRTGSYFLTFKMFVDGRRQDNLIDAISFNVERNASYEEEQGLFAKWIGGPLRFRFDWNPPTTASEWEMAESQKWA